MAAQAALLIALVVLPGRSDWPTPAAVKVAASAFYFAGFAIIIVASLSLGRSLTPTPVPVNYGALKTDGLYRFVRHPIYTGVLAIVVGLTLRSGSWIALVVAAVTVVFFTVKARWEEGQLMERYSGYAEYAAQTPRFVPRWSRRPANG